VLDLGLLAVPTFRAAIAGGFLFRVGVGAVPFLLPLMLQAGFGLSAFRSGLLTFSAALGAIAMKVAAAPVLRRFGFKRVLVGNAVLGATFLAATGLFRPDTPHGLILAVLLAGGFFRSLQFTSLNTIAYADIPPERLSRATSFASVAQQLSLSAGVALGALALHLAASGRHGGGGLATGDFAPAFLAVAAVATLSALVFARLPADAGAEVSGHAAGGGRP
jgi:MFS family permease